MKNIFSINKNHSFSKTHNQVKQSVKVNPLPGSGFKCTKANASKVCGGPGTAFTCSWTEAICKPLPSNPKGDKYCGGCITDEQTEFKCNIDEDCCLGSKFYSCIKNKCVYKY